MNVDPVHGTPRSVTFALAEEPGRVAARIPAPGLRSMSGREPEDGVDGPRGLALLRLTERGRPRSLAPRAAAVGRAEHGRPQVAGLRSDQQRLRLARILNYVMDDLPEELRPAELPRPPPRVALQRECAFARADPDRHRAGATPSSSRK